MGCTASKLDNEDTVRRCKDRRRLMKEVVHARHHLAAAHSDYCHSLRLTGSSLTSFAAGEPIAVSDQAPAIYVRNTTSSVASSVSSFSRSSTMPRVRPAGGGVSTPLTPLPEFFPDNPTVARSVSSISSSQNVKKSRYRDQNRDRYRKAPKLPHILSESSPNSSPGSLHSNIHATYEAKATYSRTPSQASSMWNWENFYPPSPPDSEFFHRKKEEDEKKYKFQKDHTGHQQQSHHIEDDEVEEEDDETEREEVQCSEWGDRDRYTTTSSSDEEEDDGESRRSEIGGRSDFGSSVQPPPQKESFVLPNKFSSMNKADKFDDAGSSTSYGGGGSDIADMRMVVRHKDLTEIVAAIRENFDNAAAAGEQVSEMLETGRAQLDQSFRRLKKTVYHSSGVFSNLSSSWSSKPPLAVKYRLDTGSLDEPGGPRSLCSTVERLLAWEKKLYQEVKAREGVKIEHEKKLSTLQNQEYKGGDEVKLDKTKASIRRLQSLIIVTSQAASTTSAAITGLRDSDLVPQLAELCHGFMYMWRSMNQYHEVQNQIVQQVRGLVNRSSKGDSTSDLHRQATRDLESAVSLWHSSFCRLIKFQRDFVRSLHGWLKLSLLPISSDNVPNNRETNEVSSFCEEWKQSLDRLPDTVASEAINSFVNVVHSISVKQSEELKIKKRTETVAKELEKKSLSLRNIEKKYYHSYSMVGIGLNDSRSDSGHILDARDPLSEKKYELAACQRRVEDEMLRHKRAVEVTRAMTLNNIQTGLPGVFQAMASFSTVFTEALESVCTRSYAIK